MAFLPGPASAAPAAAGEPARCAPVWSSSTAYPSGGAVSHHGRNWTAKWWTRNENPGATTVWSDSGACAGGVSDFVISEAEFDEIFPDRDAFYTYQGLIDALHAYPASRTPGPRRRGAGRRRRS